MVFLTGPNSNNNVVTLAWPDETERSLFEFLSAGLISETGGHYPN